jgi:hypothetical protein
MDPASLKLEDVEYYFDVAVRKARYWEKKWAEAVEVRDKLSAFLAWEGVLKWKAALKAELVKRGAESYDWTAPKPPRRLP